MKRSFPHLLILVGLLIPCFSSAADISVIGNIPTESLMDSIALSPDTGTAFGIDKEKESLHIIDVNSHCVIKKVPLGQRPAGIAVNPKNNLAYITLKGIGPSHENGSLCIVDTSGAVLTTRPITGNPHGIAVNPVNNTVVVALEQEKKLLILSADGLKTLQEIKLPGSPRLVALDIDSNRAVVTTGDEGRSWWQHIIMIVDINTGAVTKTIKLKRGVKGIAIDTEKNIAVTLGLKEKNILDASRGSILSTTREGDDFLNGIKLKGASDSLEPGDKHISDKNDTDRLLDRFYPETDDGIETELNKIRSGSTTFHMDYAFGLDINQFTHTAVISGEESLLLLDMNKNTLKEYPLGDIHILRAIAVDKSRNTALVSYLKHKTQKLSDAGVLEIQLPSALYITGVDPSEADAGTKDLPVNISGSGFTDKTTILIDNENNNCTYISDTQLQLKLKPKYLKTPGQLNIQATNPKSDSKGQEVVSNTMIFTVNDPNTKPPKINISTPQNGTVLYSSPATVSGSVDNNAVSVQANGVQASISNGTFSAIVPLVEGSNIITATATDQNGLTGSSSITVTLVTKGSISGTVTDALTGLAVSSAMVTVTDSSKNTQSTATGSDGRYSLSGIAPGAVNITITKEGYNQYSYIGTLSPGQALSVNAALTAIPPEPPPVISGIAVKNITLDSATITWTTDKPTGSLVEYGQTTAYGSSASDATLTINHTITLTGLNSSATYHNRITSKTAGGTSATSSDFIFTTASQATIAITITAPADGSTIYSSEVMVKGIVTNSTGNETGVNVNGIIAALTNNEFALNHVPLTLGANTITVTAADTTGTTVKKPITVNSVPAANYIRISANPESAAAPMEVFLRINGSFTISNPVITTVGPGDVEQLTSIDPNEYKYKLNMDGIYYFTARAVGPDGNTYQDTIAITALNLARIDTLLRAKWSAFAGAMQQKNTASALNMMLPYSRDKYQIMFNLLKEQLPNIVSTYVDLVLDSIREDRAWYKLTAMENGSLFAYRVGFMMDTNGLWLIREF
ncbi:MAG: carboxypeptidase regulatory-like domain-containing protein [Deltaproteobacteria bacterium]|nr:carboxypeptidase regulatory-like domain-containing protein [Deltaproteobacteria bacterium]